MPYRKAGSIPRASTLPPDAEAAVGVTVDALAAIYVLDSVKQFGPQKFKQLYQEGILFEEVIASPSALPLPGKRGDEIREQLRRLSPNVLGDCRYRATRQIAAAAAHRAKIFTYSSPSYPLRVYDSNNPVPVLYVRGSERVLACSSALACVGSRDIRPPYTELHEGFARAACEEGFAVVSGFAIGADTIGHKAARDSQGQTICCMPGGLDRPFPPENKGVWNALLEYEGAVFVSEFPFGTPASSLTLKKRNKLIVAFAQGVLLSQSSVKGGAMNAYRFAREQRKPLGTFAGDGAEDTSGNALIAQERRGGDMIFPREAPDRKLYVQWLRQLSSSI
jgi:DNA protecting protein DprA